MLVTGGSGFIGSHVVDALLKEGLEVRILDKAKPLQHQAVWVKADILARNDVYEAMRDVEAVFHLAAIADVDAVQLDPELCISVNELGTLNLLRAASALEVERFILASTVWVYGTQSGTVTEESPIPTPINLYTKTKIGQEHLVSSWGLSHLLPYTILRYDIPYGPRMRSNMAIAAFVRKAIRNEPVTVYGNGQQGRCWIYVTDLADAHCSVLKRSAVNQTINLAGREFVTISQIVDNLAKVFGSFPIRQEPVRTNDFLGVRTSIQKAREVLGWNPSTSFADGLSKYVNYARAEQQRPRQSTD